MGVLVSTPVALFLSKGAEVIADRVMPQSEDAEKGVLGAILKNPELMGELRFKVKRTDFFSKAHQLIYDGMLSTFEQDGTITLPLLDSTLDRKGVAGKVGGMIYISELMMGASLAHMELYTDILIEKSEARRVAGACVQVVDMLCETDDETSAIVWAKEKIKAAIEETGRHQKVQPAPIKDILTRKVTSIPYLIENLIPAREPFGLFGAGESYKTWMALEIMKAVCTGEDLLCKFRINTTGPVLLLDRENGADRLCIRLKSLGFEEEMPVHVLTDGAADSLDFGDDAFPDKFARIIDGMKEKPVLAVFDSWSRFFSKNENDIKDVAPALGRLWTISRDNNLSTILLHHTRKPGQGQQKDEDARYQVRGSGDFINALSSAISMSNKQGKIRIQAVKTRDHAVWDSFCVELVSIYDGLRFRLTDTPPSRTDKARNDEHEFLEIVTEAGPQGVSLIDVTRAMGVEKHVVQRCYKEHVHNVWRGKKGRETVFALKNTESSKK